jgi:hypothetical protein
VGVGRVGVGVGWVGVGVSVGGCGCGKGETTLRYSGTPVLRTVLPYSHGTPVLRDLSLIIGFLASHATGNHILFDF